MIKIGEGAASNLRTGRVVRDASNTVAARMVRIRSNCGAKVTNPAILKWASQNRFGWHQTDPGNSQHNAVTGPSTKLPRDEPLNTDLFDMFADNRHKLAGRHSGDMDARSPLSQGTRSSIQAPCQASTVMNRQAQRINAGSARAEPAARSSCDES